MRRNKTLCQRLPVPVWCAAAMLALALLVWATRLVAEHHLRRDAEHAALGWAQHVVRSVPDLDLVMDGEVPSPLAQDHLTVLRHLGDVYRFRFHAPDGRLLLRSESVGVSVSPEDGAADPVAADLARRSAHEGASLVRLRLGAPGADEPAVYTEAYVPVRLGGRVAGVVQVDSDQSARAERVALAFGTIGLLVAMMLVLLFALGLRLWLERLRKQRAAEAQARYLAAHDPLTGASNRASFREAIDRAGQRWREGRPGHAVLCVDVDHFKDINEACGLACGDELLRQVARRLAALVRSGDVVARIGGDTFAVLQTAVADGPDVATLAQRIVESLGEPYELLGRRIDASASVGAALHGVDGRCADELLHRADVAMVNAKRRGRAAYAFYDPALEQQLSERRETTRLLREALAGEGLALHYQPLYAADGRTLHGYEALARWSHPVRGPVPPAEFVPLAEETGLIDALGRWALRRACREAARWPAPLSVAVNLSAAQFRDTERLVADVREALAESGLAAERLELEITESLLISHSERVLDSLRELHELGVRIALDDFGTGYSSLSYLWRFPFDKVKIDRSFVQHMQSDEKVHVIVRSIVSLARALGIAVNAEGVETESQLELLRQHGCDELQGYLLGRPMPLEALPHLRAATTAAGPADAPARGAVADQDGGCSASLPAAGHRSTWSSPQSIGLVACASKPAA